MLYNYEYFMCFIQILFKNRRYYDVFMLYPCLFERPQVQSVSGQRRPFAKYLFKDGQTPSRD